MKKNKSANQICNNTIHPSLHLILSSCLPSISMQRKDIINCVVLIMPFDHATNTIVIFLKLWLRIFEWQSFKIPVCGAKICKVFGGKQKQLINPTKKCDACLEIYYYSVIFYFSSIFIYIFVNTSIWLEINFLAFAYNIHNILYGGRKEYLLLDGFKWIACYNHYVFLHFNQYFRFKIIYKMSR